MLRIDMKTLMEEIGLFARVLVDVDLLKDLPNEILITRREKECFVAIDYESCLDYGKHCYVICHSFVDCRFNKSKKVLHHQVRQQRGRLADQNHR